MIKKRLALLLALILIAAVALAGCNNSGTSPTPSSTPTASVEPSSTPTPTPTPEASTADGVKSTDTFTITFSSFQLNLDPSVDTGGIAKAYEDQVTTLYKQMYPNATIQWDLIDLNTLPAMLASGTEDDVYFHQSTAMTLGKGGYAADLSDVPQVSQMTDVANRAGVVTYNGQVLCAPCQAFTGWAFWYNKDLFAQAGITTQPKTWSDLMADCATLKAAGITPFEFGFGDGWTIGGPLLATCQALVDAVEPALGDDLYSGTAKLTDPVFQNWFTDLQAIIDNGYMNKDAMSIGWDQSRADFEAGKGAIMCQGSWLPSMIQSEMTAAGQTPINVGCVILQGDNGPTYSNASVGNMVSINPNTKYLQQAKDLVSCLIDPTALGPWMTDQGASPYKNITITYTLPAIQDYANQLAQCIPGTSVYDNSNTPASVQTDWGNTWTKMLSGQKATAADFTQMQNDYDKDKGTLVR